MEISVNGPKNIFTRAKGEGKLINNLMLHGSLTDGRLSVSSQTTLAGLIAKLLLPGTSAALTAGQIVWH